MCACENSAKGKLVVPTLSGGLLLFIVTRRNPIQPKLLMLCLPCNLSANTVSSRHVSVFTGGKFRLDTSVCALVISLGASLAASGIFR